MLDLEPNHPKLTLYHDFLVIWLQVGRRKLRFTRMIEGVGLHTYSERLQILDLTSLAERRSRGDLIEVYKATQLAGVLNCSTSGLNIICTPGKCKDSKINRLRRNFINDRIMFSWNKLPIEVEISSSLNIFKSNLEIFKRKTIA